MTRSTLILLAACGAPQVHSSTVSAPLSLAADAQMLTVPAGQFVSGSTPEERAQAYDDFTSTAHSETARENKWFDGEDDRHLEKTMPAFQIDLMPVTQSAYAEFVATGAVPAPMMTEPAWKAQGFAQDYAEVARFNWKDGLPPQNKLDHPVVLVMYDEAAAYCAWRGKLAGTPRRLPTAMEYEKAERGDSGVAYPWGNSYDADKLDSAVKGPGDTVPVGQFTAGASPYGVLDLAGNVFEWTSTPFSGDKRTVKGSAFEDFGGVGRGAGRHGRPPHVRHVIIGFRCAAEAPPEP